MSEIYIMALRVGPKPQECNVSDHGIAHTVGLQFLQNKKTQVKGASGTSIHVVFPRRLESRVHSSVVVETVSETSHLC